ncbi:MAG TPA: magnesium transporter [Thermoanaerobaculia bacterium]|nr:magnesium transporter [Thermoanaerobaculia bacterium]
MAKADAGQVMSDAQRIVALSEELHALPPPEAARRLRAVADDIAGRALALLNPAEAVDVIGRLPAAQRARIVAAAPEGRGEQWQVNLEYPEETVGRLMERAPAVFPPDAKVGDVIETLRELVKRTLITYIFVKDAAGRLIGVLAFRDLLFASRDQRLDEVMLRDPFSLLPRMPLVEAMRAVVTRHYPAYPVTDANGVLVGMVRGQTLFERQAFDISAQAGSMVGVEKEERVATHWWRSFRFRHPWLQLNLLTAFLAAAVVGAFQHTVDRIVVLAAFLPVLAGQSGNSGCQALAVTLRGLTLGDLRNFSTVKLVIKEAWVGLLNGVLIGLIAGGGMWWYAHQNHTANSMLLGGIVWMAMTASCVISGIAGALVPLTLKKLGADPATASSIFLTTATDVCSMGLLLALATLLAL